MSNKWIFVTIFSICTFSSLHAFSLQEGTREVMTTHPVILERLHNYRSTLEDLRTTESQYLPSVDYTATYARDKTKSPSTAGQNISLNSYENSLQITQNLFNGFGTRYEADYNKARIVSASYHYVENVNDVIYNFVSAYINAVKSRDIMMVALSNVNYNEEIKIKVEKIFDAGLTTRSEVEKADTSLSLARSNYVVAQNNLDDALFTLEYIYGKKITATDLDNVSFTGELPDSLESLREYARYHNPSVLVSNYNIKAAVAQKNNAYKGYYPSIDAFARKSWANDVGGLAGSDDRTKMGLTLSFNLYKGGADESQIQKNMSKINQENELKRNTIRKLDEQGALAWAAKKNLTNQIIHLKRYEETSIKTLELYQKEYDLGRRTLLDLLTAQNDHVAAQTQIIRAENDLMLAHFRIQDAMGTMVSSILGTQEDAVFSTVGLKALDNRTNNDSALENLILSDRKNGKYKRDN